MEGSLEAPTRHVIPWQDEAWYDEAALEAELRRVYDICHGCRRCFNLCDSFPRLFDLIDNGLIVARHAVAQVEEQAVRAGEQRPVILRRAAEFADVDEFIEQVSLVADTDGNGVADGLEDPDEDGLTTRWEYRLGLHPLRQDTDGDGTIDREIGWSRIDAVAGGACEGGRHDLTLLFESD